MEAVARSSGIKDATVVPILNLITAKGKALRSKKVSCDVNINMSDDTGQEMPTQDNLAQVIPNSMDVDESCVDDLVRSAVFRMITHAHTTAGSDCNTRGCPATQCNSRHHL